MTFNAAIPQATDLISASQSQIQTNFSQSNTAFGIDHTAFDVVSNQGKHKKSTYLDQAGDPATSANELAVYSKDLAGASTLYLRKESSGNVIQMSGVTPLASANGYTFLPGGILMQWGTYTITGTTSQAVTFPIPFPANVFIINITGLAPTTGNFAAWGGLSLSGFTGLRGTAAGAVAYYYTAIGN